MSEIFGTGNVPDITNGTVSKDEWIEYINETSNGMLRSIYLRRDALGEGLLDVLEDEMHNREMERVD